MADEYDRQKDIEAEGQRAAVFHHAGGGYQPRSAWGSNLGHGWVRPRPDGVKARCGGPAICPVCQKEQGTLPPPPNMGSGGQHPAGQRSTVESAANFLLCQDMSGPRWTAAFKAMEAAIARGDGVGWVLDHALRELAGQGRHGA